jgi:ketosteroid isomerase-like protein
MTRFTLVLLGLTVYVLNACNPPRAPADRDTAASPAVDKEAEERAIRAQEQRWREALTSRDSAAIGRFYAENGWYLPQQSNGYEGPGAVSARWMGERKGGVTELKREPKKVEVSDAGDMAYEVGTYDVKFTSQEGGAQEASGNYVTVWEKVGGEWKTAAYIWNRGEGE